MGAPIGTIPGLSREPFPAACGNLNVKPTKRQFRDAINGRDHERHDVCGSPRSFAGGHIPLSVLLARRRPGRANAPSCDVARRIAGVHDCRQQSECRRPVRKSQIRGPSRPMAPAALDHRQVQRRPGMDAGRQRRNGTGDMAFDLSLLAIHHHGEVSAPDKLLPVLGIFRHQPQLHTDGDAGLRLCRAADAPAAARFSALAGAGIAGQHRGVRHDLVDGVGRDVLLPVPMAHTRLSAWRRNVCRAACARGSDDDAIGKSIDLSIDPGIRSARARSHAFLPAECLYAPPWSSGDRKNSSHRWRTSRLADPVAWLADRRVLGRDPSASSTPRNLPRHTSVCWRSRSFGILPAIRAITASCFWPLSAPRGPANQGRVPCVTRPCCG